ncbi:hypothetical protein KHQ08_16520 [Pseudochrobactrum algeriensis]|nr:MULTISPECIES: hypothetical protein [Pseudochrobactrum]MBX8784514.1 hypothetical protein [Ochrobactrum sp. GRS2]QVQ36667.1 hypothetical protein KHQ08_16520 [Pseudochrobactrum algeriensis]QVQ39882.1 hypothetical protein KHQ07_14785 [Pseudochrobactrum algeriensis]QVQ43804.1 hypothetical protein KHQ09_16745 [Pseudochrobactrum algeriensis]QYM71763.1 hypothetical protein K1X45_09455 [Pseudochrobactrum sp. Wa41.01b-1]
MESLALPSVLPAFSGDFSGGGAMGVASPAFGITKTAMIALKTITSKTTTKTV